MVVLYCLVCLFQDKRPRCLSDIQPESRAISRYIAAKYANQGPKLLPDPYDLEATALFEQWAAVETLYFDAYAAPLVAEKVFNKYVDFTCISLE
jgi:glutathione S-transferase